MFLSYQRFFVRWRSLGESNPCFSLERAKTDLFPVFTRNCLKLIRSQITLK